MPKPNAVPHPLPFEVHPETRARLKAWFESERPSAICGALAKPDFTRDPVHWLELHPDVINRVEDELFKLAGSDQAEYWQGVTAIYQKFSENPISSDQQIWSRGGCSKSSYPDLYNRASRNLVFMINRMGHDAQERIIPLKKARQIHPGVPTNATGRTVSAHSAPYSNIKVPTRQQSAVNATAIANTGRSTRFSAPPRSRDQGQQTIPDTKTIKMETSPEITDAEFEKLQEELQKEKTEETKLLGLKRKRYDELQAEILEVHERNLQHKKVLEKMREGNDSSAE